MKRPNHLDMKFKERQELLQSIKKKKTKMRCPGHEWVEITQRDSNWVRTFACHACGKVEKRRIWARKNKKGNWEFRNM